MSKNIKSHVNEEKRISRFKKWYHMSFLKEMKFKNNKIVNNEITPKKNICDLNLTPKLSFILNNEKQFNGRSDKKLAKTFSNFNINRRNDLKDRLNLSSEESTSYIINQAEIGLRKFLSETKEKFFNRIIKGPPETFRWISWIIASNIPEDRNDEIFQNLLKQEIDKKTDVQIKKDLNRTLSEDNCFLLDHTQNALYNVLKSYASSDKEVAYCQGMNFIAGFLLIISDFNETDTFYMMMSLFMFTFGEDNLGIRGFYINEFPLLKLYVYQFENIFAKLMPNLKEHFDTLEVPNELWISKWFQTLFTICLPLDLLVRVWDCIFAKGLDFVFNFSFALLRKFEKKLLEFDDISDISQHFRNMNPYLTKKEERIIFNVEELISDALQIKISKSLLNQLRIEYENKFKVDLSILKVKYDIKSFDSSSKESVKNTENNFEIKENKFENLINPNSHHLDNEKSKKTTHDLSSMNKINVLENENSYDISINDETSNSICSEFDLFDNNVVLQNVKAHTFRVNIPEKEEKTQIRSLTTKINTINPSLFTKNSQKGKKNI